MSMVIIYNAVLSAICLKLYFKNLPGSVAHEVTEPVEGTEPRLAFMEAQSMRKHAPVSVYRILIKSISQLEISDSEEQRQ